VHEHDVLGVEVAKGDYRALPAHDEGELPSEVSPEAPIEQEEFAELSPEAPADLPAEAAPAPVIGGFGEEALQSAKEKEEH
jgi:hypothetical protein